MRIKDLIKAIKAVTVFTAFASLVSCKSEIVDGTTDIDSWPLPSIEVTFPEKFVHPGVAFSQEDIDRWRKIVKDHVSPQYEGFEVLKNDKLSQANYVLNGPYKELYAGEGEGRPSIYIQYANDFAAACQCAIMFAATGQKSYADKALEVIRSYAKTVKGEVFDAREGGSDHILMIGNICVKYVYAVELLRYLPDSGMTDDDFRAACDMLRAACVPPLDDFFARTDPKQKAVGNFGAAAMNCYMCMGILFDDMAMYKKAIDIYLNGYESGSIRYYIDGETGQCQESGRDQTHAQLGIGMLSMLCEVAWKQGTDLYGVLDNRLLKGYEYTAQYNLGYDVPFKYMPELTGKYNWYELDQVDKEELANGDRTESRRGKFSPIYERAYNHYVTRKGLSMPYLEEVLQKIRPEGNGAPDIAHLGFGTFLYCSQGF